MNTSLAAERQEPLHDKRTREYARLPQLDGVRGLAIILVMLVHLGSILRVTGIGKLLGFGWIGVDLFFALSGFLITRILVRSRTHEGYWWRFYSRRILRIWPLYYAYLLVSALLIFLLLRFHAHVHLPTSTLSIPASIVVHMLLAQNLIPATGFSYSDFVPITWSLCIEEHFYLLWPFLIRRLSIVRLKYVLAALLLLLPLTRFAAYYAVRGHMPFEDYYQMITRFTPFHLDGLAVGSLLALFWEEADPEKYRTWFHALFAGGLLASVVLMIFAQSTSAFAFTFSTLAIMFAGFIGLSLCGWQRAILTNPGLRYAGKISYALYLIHPTIFFFLQAHTLYALVGLGNHTYIAEILAALLAVAISFGIATLSWKYFESPILRLKNRMAPE